CDLEYDWNYDHADLSKAPGSQINSDVVGIWGKDHGTGVLGEMVSDDNGWGTKGICHAASLKTCGTYYGSPSPSWNVPNAILLAVSRLSPGDVILLEQQWGYGEAYIPVEWWTNYEGSDQTLNAAYAAIQTAVANGIHVVQAAANGGFDLDTLTWYGDSGAIIVGAGGASAGWDLRRLAFSCYGSRVDLQGWGQYVVTTGYGELYDAEGSNYYYTATFGGTSSASPIVAGAVVLLEAYWRATFGMNCPPKVARDILSYTGTPQVNPAEGLIGPRPNLRAALTNDVDGDTIPDGWEARHGLCVTNRFDAMEDADGDGSSNIDEHRADTDPTNRLSCLRIVDIQTASPTEVVFAASTQRTYSVSVASNPPPLEWRSLVSGVPGTGALVSVTDTSVVESARFYRVQTGL
ncbi:S8 family serine peptidase, partial [Verrucomicrobiota bacterium]